MSPEATRAAIARELGLAEGQLGAVFEWINLERPLGSASISQVPCVQGGSFGRGSGPLTVAAGNTAGWRLASVDICVLAWVAVAGGVTVVGRRTTPADRRGSRGVGVDSQEGKAHMHPTVSPLVGQLHRLQ